MTPAPDSRRWVAAGVAAILVVFAVDRLTSANVALVTLSAAGPLIAALGGSRRATTGVAALAIAVALVELLLAGPLGLQDGVRLLTVLVVSTLAVVLAALRGRLEQRTAEARSASRQAEETLALLDVIFGRAPVGLAFHDLEGRYVRINDHLAAINGRPPEEHIGRTLAEILPELPEVGDDVRRVAATGEPATGVEVRGETPAQPGVLHEWVASYWPVRAAAGGALLGVGAVVFDVTDRRAAERAVRTQTDRYETLLAALSEVGEGMVVIEDGRCVYANHAFEQLSGYTFPELTALESLYELLEPEEREEAAERARLRLERDLVDTTYTVGIRRRDGGRVALELAGVPLEIAGPPARRQLVVVVRDVTARRRAEAERERLLAERTAIATTLQRSLLPPDLPRIPGAQLAARYRASGDGIELGGDFYDCFATGGGDWALVIGDVCGKGAEAAAITALARYTLRASVLHTRRPAQVLAGLNEALLRQGLDYRFCTALYASVTPAPDGCEVVLAAGGHPLPLVVRAGGKVEQAGTPGTLLGIVRDPVFSEQRVKLGPGDALVLYTDGVVEASPTDDALAPERLAELLHSLEGCDAGAIAAAVERTALAVQDGRLRDDVAVVVLRSTPFDQPAPGATQPA